MRKVLFLHGHPLLQRAQLLIEAVAHDTAEQVRALGAQVPDVALDLGRRSLFPLISAGRSEKQLGREDEACKKIDQGHLHL